MRFFYTFTLSALVLIYLLSDNVIGAPSKGRYTWIKCKPNSKNANCSKQTGPWINIPGPPERVHPRAVADIEPDKSSEESTETESSAYGSGDFYSPTYLTREERDIGAEIPQWLKQNEVVGENKEEGSGGEVEYSNDIAPVPVKPRLSAKDLLEENMIE